MQMRASLQTLFMLKAQENMVCDEPLKILTEQSEHI